MPVDNDEDDDIPASASLVLLVGDLRGRQREQEKRMNRNETWVGERFTSMERKVDDKFTAINGKVDGLDAKMDQILEVLATQAGGRAALKVLLQPAFILWGSLLSGAVALGLHFFFKVTQ